jgi:hypothetical protein
MSLNFQLVGVPFLHKKFRKNEKKKKTKTKKNSETSKNSEYFFLKKKKN